MPVTYNQAFFQDNSNRDGDHGGCPSGMISRHRKGSSGRRRHWCLNPATQWISHMGSRNGQNPCTLASSDSASWIGGGKDGGGNLSNYPGKSTNFNNSEAALKCTFNSVTSDKLVQLSQNSSVMQSGAVETNGQFKNQWDQLIWGMTTQAGNTTGFCTSLDHLDAKIHSDGRTCYDILVDEATKKARGLQWCANNPTDSKCACINVSNQGVKGCVDNPTLPGCDEVVEEYNKFPGNAQSEIETKNFSVKCFVPNICSRDGQYQPNAQPDVCSQTITVCKQDAHLYGDIKNGGVVNLDQSMECSAETNNQSNSDSGSGSGSSELIVPKTYEEFKTFIPMSVDGLTGDKRQQTGAGVITASSLSCCMCIVLLLIIASG